MRAQRINQNYNKDANRQRTIQSPQKTQKLVREQNVDHRLSMSTTKQNSEALGQSNFMTDYRGNPHNLSQN